MTAALLDWAQARPLSFHTVVVLAVLGLVWLRTRLLLARQHARARRGAPAARRLREGATRSQVKWPTGHPVPPPPPPGRGVRGRTVPPPLRRPDDVATLQRRIVDLQAHASDLAARLRAAAPATGHTVVPDELPPAALRYLADFDMDDVGNSRGVAAQECWAELLRRLQAAAPPPGTTRHTVVACRCWPCNAPGRGPQ